MPRFLIFKAVAFLFPLKKQFVKKINTAFACLLALLLAVPPCYGQQVVPPPLAPPAAISPFYLRALSCDRLTGDVVASYDRQGKNADAQKLFKYLLTGIKLPNSLFWVNLRPGGDKMIDERLAATEVGRIMLEADVQLKKDTAMLTHPGSRNGKEYWAKLRAKAAELYGDTNPLQPLVSRPWIVPGQIIMRTGRGQAYVYKALLDVRLESDRLQGRPQPENSRLRELNDFSAELMRRLILPGLVERVNTGAEYASLRQVFHSLILAQWFKKAHAEEPRWKAIVDSNDCSGVGPEIKWSKEDILADYERSFTMGEYEASEHSVGVSGAVIRRYSTGGENLVGLGATSLIFGEEDFPHGVLDDLELESQRIVLPPVLGIDVHDGGRAGWNLEEEMEINGPRGALDHIRDHGLAEDEIRRVLSTPQAFELLNRHLVGGMLFPDKKDAALLLAMIGGKALNILIRAFYRDTDPEWLPGLAAALKRDGEMEDVLRDLLVNRFGFDDRMLEEVTLIKRAEKLIDGLEKNGLKTFYSGDRVGLMLIARNMLKRGEGQDVVELEVRRQSELLSFSPASMGIEIEVLENAIEDFEKRYDFQAKAGLVAELVGIRRQKDGIIEFALPPTADYRLQMVMIDYLLEQGCLPESLFSVHINLGMPAEFLRRDKKKDSNPFEADSSQTLTTFLRYVLSPLALIHSSDYRLNGGEKITNKAEVRPDRKNVRTVEVDRWRLECRPFALVNGSNGEKTAGIYGRKQWDVQGKEFNPVDDFRNLLPRMQALAGLFKQVALAGPNRLDERILRVWNGHLDRLNAVYRHYPLIDEWVTANAMTGRDEMKPVLAERAQCQEMIDRAIEQTVKELRALSEEKVVRESAAKDGGVNGDVLDRKIIAELKEYGPIGALSYIDSREVAQRDYSAVLSTIEALGIVKEYLYFQPIPQQEKAALLLAYIGGPGIDILVDAFKRGNPYQRAQWIPGVAAAVKREEEMPASLRDLLEKEFGFDSSMFAEIELIKQAEALVKKLENQGLKTTYSGDRVGLVLACREMIKNKEPEQASERRLIEIARAAASSSVSIGLELEVLKNFVRKEEYPELKAMLIAGMCGIPLGNDGVIEFALPPSSDYSLQLSMIDYLMEFKLLPGPIFSLHMNFGMPEGLTFREQNKALKYIIAPLALIHSSDYRLRGGDKYKLSAKLLNRSEFAEKNIEHDPQRLEFRNFALYNEKRDIVTQGIYRKRQCDARGEEFLPLDDFKRLLSRAQTLVSLFKSEFSKEPDVQRDFRNRAWDRHMQRMDAIYGQNREFKTWSELNSYVKAATETVLYTRAGIQEQVEAALELIEAEAAEASTQAPTEMRGTGADGGVVAGEKLGGVDLSSLQPESEEFVEGTAGNDLQPSVSGREWDRLERMVECGMMPSSDRLELLCLHGSKNIGNKPLVTLARLLLAQENKGLETDTVTIRCLSILERVN